jgi:hypothetical protein
VLLTSRFDPDKAVEWFGAARAALLPPDDVPELLAYRMHGQLG